MTVSNLSHETSTIETSTIKKPSEYDVPLLTKEEASAFVCNGASLSCPNMLTQSNGMDSVKQAIIELNKKGYFI